jgi:hypothetical protein
MDSFVIRDAVGQRTDIVTDERKMSSEALKQSRNAMQQLWFHKSGMKAKCIRTRGPGPCMTRNLTALGHEEYDLQEI